MRVDAASTSRGGRPEICAEVAPLVETAGPELGSSVQWVVPLGFNIEFVMNLDLGVAWFPHALERGGTMRTWQPFLELNAGIGF